MAAEFDLSPLSPLEKLGVTEAAARHNAEIIGPKNKAIEAANKVITDKRTANPDAPTDPLTPLIEPYSPEAYFTMLAKGWAFNMAGTNQDSIAKKALADIAKMPAANQAALFKAMGLEGARPQDISKLALDAFVNLPREQREQLATMVYGA